MELDYYLERIHRDDVDCFQGFIEPPIEDYFIQVIKTVKMDWQMMCANFLMKMMFIAYSCLADLLF